ncbi:MAG: carboxypeptidase regulatory-like domain-containing protein, partial [Acidobacteria bacterium]|nr:carboxypeptidase regulatory-like domain-containing protein [Acidobacteriota bacterium]
MLVMPRAILALFASALWLPAQQDMGLITGIVTDSSGAAVPGARVTVVNPATNESRTVQTAEAGAYTVGPLRIGTYDVSVEQPGFKKAAWTGITVSAQDRVRADFKLEIGQLSETVSVTAEAPLLNAETATLAHVVEERAIRQLPLNGRNF